MTILRSRPAGAASRDSVHLDDAPLYWADGRRVYVRQAGRTVLACTVTPQPDASWLITDCLPQRRHPDLARLLLRVCERLVDDHGLPGVVAIHPDFWSDTLAEGGAVPLQRIVPMWSRLNADLLPLHTRPLPSPLRFTPLGDDATALGGLGDAALWRDILAGAFGPVIPAASRAVVDGGTTGAAIAFSEYQGAPLLAHLVVADAVRGTGLGRSLLAEGLVRLSQAGYVDCHLNVEADNTVAHRLYRSVGFVPSRWTLRVSHIPGRRPGDD